MKEPKSVLERRRQKVANSLWPDSAVSPCPVCVLPSLWVSDLTGRLDSKRKKESAKEKESS